MIFKAVGLYEDVVNKSQTNNGDWKAHNMSTAIVCQVVTKPIITIIAGKIKDPNQIWKYLRSQQNTILLEYCI